MRNKRFSHPSAALYLYNNIQPLTSARLQAAADFFWGSAKCYTPKSLIAVTFLYTTDTTTTTTYYGVQTAFISLMCSRLGFHFGTRYQSNPMAVLKTCFFFVPVYVHMYGYVS